VTPEPWIEALRSPLAQELEPAHFEKLKNMAVEVRFKEDWIIFREEEDCEAFFLILSGRVALEMALKGRVICVQTLRAGDEFGWSSVLMKYGKHFQARCMCPVRALSVHGADLLEACKGDTAFGFAIMRRLLEVVAGRLEATRYQLSEIFNFRTPLR
jgi:CRP/FNR family transcriptional regulator, cyclic AMP receptor protein